MHRSSLCYACTGAVCVVAIAAETSRDGGGGDLESLLGGRGWAIRETDSDSGTSPGWGRGSERGRAKYYSRARARDSPREYYSPARARGSPRETLSKERRRWGGDGGGKERKR